MTVIATLIRSSDVTDSPTILPLWHDFATMTCDEGLAFAARTRRQLDRFELLPNADGNGMDPALVARARVLIDELERDIRDYLAGRPRHD
jgi:hypothetical protein